MADGMTPHVSGTSLSAQARYAAGTREILECFFEGGRSATNISSLMAANLLVRARIHTALETQPADPRRLQDFKNAN